MTPCTQCQMKVHDTELFFGPSGVVCAKCHTREEEKSAQVSEMRSRWKMYAVGLTFSFWPWLVLHLVTRDMLPLLGLGFGGFTLLLSIWMYFDTPANLTLATVDMNKKRSVRLMPGFVGLSGLAQIAYAIYISLGSGGS